MADTSAEVLLKLRDKLRNAVNSGVISGETGFETTLMSIANECRRQEI